jgi:hypothetical protein
MDKKIKIWFNKFKVPVTILGMLLIVGVIFLIGKSFADPDSGYLRNQVVNGLSFEDASLVYENGITTFTVDVYNESGNTYNLKTISINLTDSDNNITTLVGYIGETLDKDEVKLITASIDKDLSSSVKLEYVINK